MNTTLSKKSVADDNCLEAHREVIRRSLHEITIELETALRDASLSFPIYLAIPDKGGSLITFASLPSMFRCDYESRRG